ncbi:hypothetical protein DV515_00015238, partial [Chloebia gouldiae]
MLTCMPSKEKGKHCKEKTWIMPLKLLMNLLFWKPICTNLPAAAVARPLERDRAHGSA